MRVLFISRVLPGDLRTSVYGVFQRLAMFIEAIGRIAELDLLLYAPADGDFSPSGVAAMERSLSSYWNVPIRLHLCPRRLFGEESRWETYGPPALSFVHQPAYRQTAGPEQVAAFEACLTGKPDFIFAYGLASMSPVLLSSQPRPPVLFDLNDIEHVALVRGVDRRWTWRQKITQYSRLPALWWGERQAVRRAHAAFVCSETDRRYLTSLWRLPGIAVVPNAVRTAKRLPVAKEPTVLFLGTYGYKPNVDAAVFLIERVWPRVYQAMPQARLIIGGGSPESIPGYTSEIPGVAFTGFVDDLESLYRQARVVCAPILSGGGTRIKIIEAAAYGRAIVSTRIGAEGLDLRDGHELLLRDDPEPFAAACLDLLGDAALCERLGSAAYASVQEHYLREKVMGLIQSYFTNNRQTADRPGRRERPHDASKIASAGNAHQGRNA